MGFYSLCYCLLFLVCRVFALSCQCICAIVVILFALSWVISVQQFTKFLRFRYSSHAPIWAPCNSTGQSVVGQAQPLQTIKHRVDRELFTALDWRQTIRDVKASRPKFWPRPHDLWPRPRDPLASASSFWSRPRTLIFNFMEPGVLSKQLGLMKNWYGLYY